MFPCIELSCFTQLPFLVLNLNWKHLAKLLPDNTLDVKVDILLVFYLTVALHQMFPLSWLMKVHLIQWEEILEFEV